MTFGHPVFFIPPDNKSVIKTLNFVRYYSEKTEIISKK